MMKLLDELTDYIELETGVKCNVGQMPDKPSSLAVFNFKAGVQPDYAFSDRNSYRRRPFAQIMLRDSDFYKGLENADKVFREMERVYGNFGSKYILGVTSTTDILEYGRDESNRYRFLMNFIVDIKED